MTNGTLNVISVVHIQSGGQWRVGLKTSGAEVVHDELRPIAEGNSVGGNASNLAILCDCVCGGHLYLEDHLHSEDHSMHVCIGDDTDPGQPVSTPTSQFV
jgi:hypothetical protein